MKDLNSVLKDRVILFGWIAGLTLIAALLWSFSFHFHSVSLMHSTNKALALMEDSRRLSAPLLRPFSGPAPLGCWYTLSESSAAGSGSLFFVFAIMRDGILVPCGAEISEKGEVVQIMPLGSHAQQVIAQIPQGLIQVYIRRIESAAAAITTAPERGGK